MQTNQHSNSNLYKKTLKIIDNFYNIQSIDNLFDVLKKVIPFESGYIFYDNNKKPEYSHNAIENYQDFEPFLCENLKYENTVFGKILILGKNFSNDEKFIFKSLAPIISNIVKDKEISNIVKMQFNALQKGYEETLESEKIKTKFLSHVSHELRTPLNSILGFSDFLEQEFVGPLNEKQKEYINDIKISGLHLLEMVNEILDMSKIEANAVTLNLKEFNIIELVTEVLNILKPLALKKNIKIINKSSDVKIKADYQKLQQILFNLLSNAIKFTPRGGEIKIDWHLKNTKFILSVKDNGIGIEPKFHKKIFEKFEQAGESQECSTGLGLAITKELVKLHGGTIRVESELGKGAEFTVEI